MQKVGSQCLRQVQSALDEYSDEVEESDLARSTKDTYLQHSREFVRWLNNDFVPGGGQGAQ